MVEYTDDGEWILVSRRRKQNQHHRRTELLNTGRQDWRRNDGRSHAPDAYYRSGHDGGPYRSREHRSYAAVMRMRSRQGDYYPQECFPKQGFQPQFFEPRRRYSDPQNQKTRSARSYNGERCNATKHQHK